MNGQFRYYAYTTDANQVFRVRLRASNAANGGFVLAATTVPRLPRGIVMRFVRGVVEATGARKKIYQARRTSPVWSGGSTFVNDGLTFKVIERVGERRRVF